MGATASRAVILRVDRRVAGRDIPFDKIYFFERSVTPLIPKIFPFSLVLTLTDRFAQQLLEYYDNAHRSFEKTRHFPLHRRDEGKISIEELDAALPTVLNSPAAHWMVISVLHRARSKDSSSPAYLTAVPPNKRKKAGVPAAQSKNEKLRRKVVSVLDDIESYMLIAGEKYQPICLACASHLDMLNGHCFFGSAECYKQLVQLCPSNYVRAQQAYDDFVGKTPPIPDNVIGTAKELHLDSDEEGALWDRS